VNLIFAGALGDQGVERENQSDKDDRREVDAALFVVEIGITVFACLRVSIGGGHDETGIDSADQQRILRCYRQEQQQCQD